MDFLNILKKKWYVFLILFIVVGIFLFNKKSSTAATRKTATYTVKKQIIKDTLSLSGKIDAEERATLRFQSSGRLAWVGVKIGDEVKKYQVIASLDKRDIQNRMQKYLNSYMTARWSFDQAKDDDKGIYVDSLTEDQRNKVGRLVDQSQFALDNSVLDVELQNLALEYSNLSSPIEGTVVRADAPYAGVNIIPTQAEFEVVNPKTLYFSALADQTEVVQLHNAMQGQITLDSYPDKTFNGGIHDIAFTPKEGESSTVYEVKIHFNDQNTLSQYRIGMSGDVNFDLRERQAITIPREFIKQEAEKKYVWKDQNGTKVKVAVTVGDTEDNFTEITSGLQEGDVIYDQT